MDWPLPRLETDSRRAIGRTKRQGAISAPETASSTKLRAGSQLLTKSSWHPGQLTSTRRVTEISSPEETHGIPETALVLCTQESKGLGPGEVIRHTAQLGE